MVPSCSHQVQNVYVLQFSVKYSKGMEFLIRRSKNRSK
jgi:hypothetical protein